MSTKPDAKTTILTTPLKLTGFTKPSNLLLFLFTVGVFALFSIFNLIFSLPEGHRLKPNPPGPLYWFHDGFLKVVMQMHLYSVLPAGILLPLQFLPIMRRRFMPFHKLAGRILFLLLILGNITALLMSPHSFNGPLETCIWVLTVASMTTFSLLKAWSSIRNFQIARHRRWVLRTWSYACTILSLRICMIIIAIATEKLTPNTYMSTTTCDELAFMYKSVKNESSIASLSQRFPACSATGSARVLVQVSLSSFYPEERAAMMNMVFGVSGWVALTVHILVTEWYLNSTKEEDERLRRFDGMRRKAE